MKRNIILCSREGEELKFSINSNEKIIFYLKSQIKEINSFKLIYNGSILLEKDTPNSLGMMSGKIYYIDLV